MRNGSDKCRGNQKHILCSKNVFVKSAVYEKMCKTYVRSRKGTDVNVIQCMRFAHWITNATDKQS